MSGKWEMSPIDMNMIEDSNVSVLFKREYLRYIIRSEIKTQEKLIMKVRKTLLRRRYYWNIYNERENSIDSLTDLLSKVTII